MVNKNKKKMNKQRENTLKSVQIYTVYCVTPPLMWYFVHMKRGLIFCAGTQIGKIKWLIAQHCVLWKQ